MSGVLGVLLGNAGAVFSAGGTQTIGPGLTAFQVRFTNAGLIQVAVNGGAFSTLDNWITPTSNAPGPYHVRLHVTANNSPNSGDSVDADLALSSTRTWNWSLGTALSSFTITVKTGSGGTTLATGTWSIS